MANPKNKQELLVIMADNYAKLNEQIGKMTAAKIEVSFQFANDPLEIPIINIYSLYNIHL